jgi:hypothetical protein
MTPRQRRHAAVEYAAMQLESGAFGSVDQLADQAGIAKHEIPDHGGN